MPCLQWQTLSAKGAALYPNTMGARRLRGANYSNLLGVTERDAPQVHDPPAPSMAAFVTRDAPRFRAVTPQIDEGRS